MFFYAFQRYLREHGKFEHVYCVVQRYLREKVKFKHVYCAVQEYQRENVGLNMFIVLPKDTKRKRLLLRESNTKISTVKLLYFAVTDFLGN